MINIQSGPTAKELTAHQANNLNKAFENLLSNEMYKMIAKHRPTNVDEFNKLY